MIRITRVKYKGLKDWHHQLKPAARVCENGQWQFAAWIQAGDLSWLRIG